MWMMWCGLALGADTPEAPDPVVSPDDPADVPHLWYRGFGAVTFNQLGVAADGAFEVRAPVMRYGGAAFNGTFIGAGMRAAVTPVHMDLAARVSFQPIDLLPITIEGFWGNYWDSPWAPVPVDRVNDQLLRDRKPQYDAGRDFFAQVWGVNLMPTFQIQVSRVAAFTSWTISYLHTTPRQGPEPWWFDPFRGLVLDYDDWVTEHTSAIVWEFANGKDHTPIVRVGAALRGKWALNTPDETLTVGGVAMWRPGRKPTAPTMLLIVAPYLKDPDINPGVPYVAFVVSASKVVPLKRLNRLR